jgi:hypothetical protein
VNNFTYIGVLKVYRVTQKLFVTRGNLYSCYSEEFFFFKGVCVRACVCVCVCAVLRSSGFTMMYFGAPLYFFVPCSFVLIRCLKFLKRQTNALEYTNVSLLYTSH